GWFGGYGNVLGDTHAHLFIAMLSTFAGIIKHVIIIIQFILFREDNEAIENMYFLFFHAIFVAQDIDIKNARTVYSSGSEQSFWISLNHLCGCIAGEESWDMGLETCLEEQKDIFSLNSFSNEKTFARALEHIYNMFTQQYSTASSSSSRSTSGGGGGGAIEVSIYFNFDTLV
ncbi:hypothetical protein ACJX0J_041420, partial [Zea mays]